MWTFFQEQHPIEWDIFECSSLFEWLKFRNEKVSHFRDFSVHKNLCNWKICIDSLLVALNRESAFGRHSRPWIYEFTPFSQSSLTMKFQKISQDVNVFVLLQDLLARKILSDRILEYIGLLLRETFLETQYFLKAG